MIRARFSTKTFVRRSFEMCGAMAISCVCMSLVERSRELEPRRDLRDRVIAARLNKFSEDDPFRSDLTESDKFGFFGVLSRLIATRRHSVTRSSNGASTPSFKCLNTHEHECDYSPVKCLRHCRCLQHVNILLLVNEAAEQFAQIFTSSLGLTGK